MNINVKLLEILLERQMLEAGLVGFVREFKFHPTRKWRADFAFPQKMLLVEVEGGIWTQGRHTNPLGFMKDCEKYNEAAILGYRVIRVTSMHVQSPDLQALKYVKRALGISVE